ncbi:ATP-binding protein [Breznakia blatticola]|uniref:ATP-binding protein n=1 Tax=Breznakia blatticola TaxID=1754012 RepID=UPI003C7BFEEF
MNYRPERNINRSIVEQLQTNDYIRKHHNVIIHGACDTGKSFIVNALGNHACDNSHSTFYCRIFEFIDDFLINELIDKEVNYLFQLL